jgi:hypothetical protein
VPKRQCRWKIGSVQKQLASTGAVDHDADLVAWSKELDGGTWSIRDWAWGDWLWGHDPAAPNLPGVELNRCNAVGLCLAKAFQLDSTLPPAAPLISGGSIEDLTLQGLNHEVGNLQSGWIELRTWEQEGSQALLDQLLSRLGHLACYAGTCSVLDTQNQVKPYMVDGFEMLRMTQPAIRRLLNVLMVLYRSLHVHRVAAPVDAAVSSKPRHQVRRHHMFAALDDFSTVAMHWDIHPGAKLSYLYDFPGLYNSVSQVVYQLFPDYRRRVADDPLASEAGGWQDPLHTLAGIMQLFPDVPILYGDDYINLHARDQGIRWLVLDQMVFMVSHDNHLVWDADAAELAKLLK